MKQTLYIVVIFVCTVFNSASQSLAFAALQLSWKYNIPVSALIQADNDPGEALLYLSIKELGEVRVS